MRLFLSRAESELLVTSESIDPEAEPELPPIRVIEPSPETAATAERYVVSAHREQIRCLPRVADRAVVVRPRMPIFLPAGEEIRLFVSSPIWVGIEIEAPRQRLRELPSRKLSDTWFGNSTRNGELSYALKTHGRVRRDQVSKASYRVTTPVFIRNQAEAKLAVDRLSLPVPHLSVFADRGNVLWTESVTMTHSFGADLADFEIREGAPEEAGEASLLSPPRLTGQRNLLVRAFSSVFPVFAAGSD